MCREYINLQTQKLLDMNKVDKLADNAMLKCRVELFTEWNFEKNDKLNLDIYKMTKGSNRKAWWICIKCEEVYFSTIHPRVKGVNCPYCAGLKVGKINNLQHHNPELASQWHPTKNENLKPSEVTYGNNIKVWWLGKCGHEWEACVSDRNNGGKGCPYCCHNPKVLIGFNDINTTHPHLLSILNNKEDGYKYTFGSSHKLKWNCDICDNLLFKPILEVVNRGLSCPKCSDGISFGEKAMYNILVENNIEFTYDSSAPWSGTKRYDFYIPSIEAIVEIMGEQHSENTTGKFKSEATLDEVIENDKYKRELALKNGIKEYYSIDMKNKDISYFSDSCKMKELLLKLKIAYIDWNDLAIKSNKSMVSTVCNYYENNDVTSGDLSVIFKLSPPTISKYLKIGNKLGICDYQPYSQRNKQRAINKRKNKRVS